MGKDIILEAPAKVNLTLDVKGKRSDGYHELETVMHQVDLLDIIRISRTAGGIKLKSSSTLIPLNEENLAYQAAEKLLGKHARKEGLEISIEKNIPIGAGLAGGSTDAAAVIRGINKLLGLGLEKEQLLEIAASIGSDVAFCLAGGTKLARGRGEILEGLPTRVIPYIILVKPDFQLYTAEVYREFNLAEVKEVPGLTAFLAAWESCDIISIARNMRNVLETVCIKKHPVIGKIKKELMETGALGALMSGSGPSVIGIFAEKEQALQARKQFKASYPEVFLLSSYVV